MRASYKNSARLHQVSPGLRGGWKVLSLVWEGTHGKNGIKRFISGWYCGTQVKLSPRVLVSHSRMSRSKGHLHYWSNFLLICRQRGSRKWSRCLGPCYPNGKLSYSVGAWLWPGWALTLEGIWGENQQMDDRFLSISPFVSVSLKKKKLKYFCKRHAYCGTIFLNSC